MAFHHHRHHHQTTACTCQSPPCPPPPFLSFPSQTCSTDPSVIATIVSQLLQTQNNPQNHIINKPTNTNHYQSRYPSKQTHPQSSDFLSSLLQRIDNLETSLHDWSSYTTTSSCSNHHHALYLRNAAARVIQTHFRAFLVRRSRTLRQLKQLANIKSNLTCLKSSFSPHGFVDYDSLSHKAMDLLLILDSIQGEDQMIRDSKKSVTREIVQFLELVDGVCLKRHQVLTRKMRSMRWVRNGNAGTGHDSKRYSEYGRGSKCRNVDSEEKKLIAKLRERVERIGRISRALEAEEVGDEVGEGFEYVGDEDGDIIDQITGNYGVKNGGLSVNKDVLRSNGKKRVCFVEDGNVIGVYNVDGDKIIASRDVEEIEDTLKGREDEEEAQSDGERSSQSSGGTRNRRSYEVGNHVNGFTFSVPEPKADFSTRKPGVKIAG